MAANVSIQLLGPVRSWHFDQEIPLGPPHRRAVLALLASTPGEVVHRAALSELLWGDDPPVSAVNVVQTHVKHLRRALDPDRPARARDGVLRTVGDGYVLDAESVEIDLVRFRSLVSTALRARAQESVDGAAEYLRAALSLWHGEPFAGVAVLRSHPRSVLIRGERREAVLHYGDAMLARGEPGPVIPVLAGAAAAQPLDEAVAALLVRAHHAAGERGRAFAVYHDVRRRLAEELGVDPGANLAEAHELLLAPAVASEVAPEAATEAATAHPTGDAAAVIAVAGDGRRAARPGAVVPAQLPMDNPAFVGREAELALLDAVVDGPGRSVGNVVVVTGAAGVGKTALAVRWAHRVAPRYPDGQLHVDLRGFTATGDAARTPETIRVLLDAFEIPPQRIPADVTSQINLYRSLLSGRRVLLVLDNARDAQQVRPLLPGAPTCATVVTSRIGLTGLVAVEGARLVNLGLLGDDDATRLLAGRLGRERLAAEPAAVGRIVDWCAGLPLALSLVAAGALARPRHPLSAIADGLWDGAGRSLAVPDLTATFSWSYRALRPPAAAVFRLLGLHAGPDVDVSAAAALTGREPVEVAESLAELTAAHLVDEHRPGRYRTHDLLHAYAAGLAAADDGAPAARSRLLDHYARSAHAAAVLINPVRDAIELPLPPADDEPRSPADADAAWAWMEAELLVLLTAQSRAHDDGHDARAWQLAWAVTSALFRRGRWDELRRAQTIALAAAERLGHDRARAASHRVLGAVLTELRDFDRAKDHLDAALDLDSRRGDQVGLAHTHGCLDRLHSRRGRPATALRHARTAARLYRSRGHRVGEATTLNSAAWNLALLGRHEQALDHARRAMTLLDRLGDRHGQAATWDTIGFADHHRGDHRNAVRCYRRAIALFRELGDRHSESVSLGHLAATHEAAGDRRLARETRRQARDVLVRIDRPDRG